MDHARFTTIRQSVTTMLSRRQLPAVAGALVGLIAPGLATSPAAVAKRKKQRCVAINKTCSKSRKAKNACRRCCTGAFITRRKTRTCMCRAEGQPCARTSQCCGGTCDSNTCSTISSYSPGRVYGGPGAEPGRLAEPSGLGIAINGDLYVSNLSSPPAAMQQFSRSGKFIRHWGTPGTSAGELEDPYSVGVGPEGTVYVSDYQNRRVHRFTAKGIAKSAWEASGVLVPDCAPQEVVVDSRGNVVLSYFDWSPQNPQQPYVAKYSAAGELLWGPIDFPTSSTILWLAIGPDNAVYVMPDVNEAAIIVLNPDNGQQVTTITPDYPESVAPPCLAVDRAGNLFIGLTNSIAKFSAGGALIGSLSAPIDGVPLDGPEHLTVTPDGTVFVVDQGNDRVVSFIPA